MLVGEACIRNGGGDNTFVAIAFRRPGTIYKNEVLRGRKKRIELIKPFSYSLQWPARRLSLKRQRKQATAQHKTAADAQQRRRTNGREEERPTDGEDTGEQRAGKCVSRMRGLRHASERTLLEMPAV